MSERVKGWLMTAALACVPLAICINVGRVVLSAGSPRVAVPETVAAAPDDYAAVKATTADPEVRWLVLDPGLSLLPPELFRDTFTVMARGKAAGRYRIAAFTARGSKVSEPAVCTVVVGQPGPVPPVPPGPGPVPPKPPDPPQPPAPIPAAGLRVLIVYESADLPKMPPAQQSILYAKAVRDYLDAKCAAGPDGKTKEWRIFDQNVDVSGESPLWQAAMRRPRATVPWLVVSDGKAGFEGPLPADADKTLELIKKYGG